MNKILVISAITLVAVVMGLSLVTPALANDVQSHKGALVQAPFQCGGNIPGNSLCVAADGNGDGTCEGHAFLITKALAARLGITSQECAQPE